MILGLLYINPIDTYDLSVIFNSNKGLAMPLLFDSLVSQTKKVREQSDFICISSVHKNYFLRIWLWLHTWPSNANCATLYLYSMQTISSRPWVVVMCLKSKSYLQLKHLFLIFSLDETAPIYRLPCVKETHWVNTDARITVRTISTLFIFSALIIILTS